MTNDDNTVEERISGLISNMDYKERMVFIGYFYNQMSITDITLTTGISKKEIKKYLVGSCKKIAGMIGEGGTYYAALVSFLSMGEEAVASKLP